MSILEAAEKILAESKEPLKTREITRRIVEAGLWVPQTKTPADSVASAIYVDIKKGQSKFVKVGKGMFMLSSAVLPSVASKRPKAATTKSKHGPGYVYIMTNPSFKKTWVKIGFTRDEDCTVEQRRKDLSNSSVPFPFVVYATLKCPDAYHVEQKVHGLIDDANEKARLNSAREFYDLEPQRACSILCHAASLAEIDDGNLRRYKDNKPIVDTVVKRGGSAVVAKSTKGNFTFEMVGISRGAQLVFVPTGERVTALPPNKVKFNGEVYTLSGFVRKFMPSDKRIPSDSYQGPAYFTYKGRKLTALREEMERK